MRSFGGDLAGAPGADELAKRVSAASLESLGMLVAGVAHELNTPMGCLNANHDVTKRALSRLQAILADEVVEAHELAEVRRIVGALDGVLRVNDLAVERMVRLVESLRRFGRPDNAEIEFVDLHEGIEGTLAVLGHELRDRVSVVREYGELPPVQCFPHQLNQVFMNLILNAIQAIEERGTITLRTGALSGGVRVEVEDTGRGMSPGVLERVFEPGFTTKGSRVGMGLGLLMVRQIIERHGGRISARSEVGVGSTFTVLLPLLLPDGVMSREVSSGAG